MKWADLIWAAIGGALGATLRMVFADGLDAAFPWGVFLCNVIGAGLLAVGYRLKERWPPGLWHFHGAGFCGGFTTVSTLNVQVLELAAAGQPKLAVAYLIASLLAAVPLVAVVIWKMPGAAGMVRL